MHKANSVFRAIAIQLVRTVRRRIAAVAVAICGLVVGVQPAGAGIACVGDCNGDASVAINELIVGVNIALGSQPLSACPPFDCQGLGTVPINCLIQAVNSALGGCPAEPPVRLEGSCAAPDGGSDGSAVCGAGTSISVFRCDDRQTCLSAAGRTLVGSTTVDGDGSWSAEIAAADARATLLVQADVAPLVTYRALVFSPAAVSLRAALVGGVDAGIAITPATEAAIQLLAVNGFENYSDSAAQQVVRAVEQATAGLSFDGLSAAEAATLALDTASADPAVMTVLQTARNTPAATDTAAPNGTPTVGPSATVTNLPTSTATGASTGTPTTLPTSSPTQTPTRTNTSMPTSTRTPAPTAPPTSTRKPLVDNGDGTITDQQTGLMWEKKDLNGGLHDVRERQAWAGRCAGSTDYCQPDAASQATCSAATGGAFGCGQCPGTACVVFGGTVWQWLNELNAANFAGHNDWRLPTVAQSDDPAELETLVDLRAAGCKGPAEAPCIGAAFSAPCPPSGCELTTCSCATAKGYWSATTHAEAGHVAWGVSFADGTLGFQTKENAFAVRAVRGGP
jgi:hypothetical protein